MLHHAIIGQSGCGKTTLAKKLAAGLIDRKISVAVLDPFRDEWPKGVEQTHHPDVMLAGLVKMIRRGGKWAIFVDESSHALDRYDQRFDFLATGARHCGITTYFIAQRHVQLSPNIRGSVTTWWIFANPDGVKLATLLNQRKLESAADLRQGEFFLVQPFKPLLKGSIKFSGKKNVAVDLKAA